MPDDKSRRSTVKRLLARGREGLGKAAEAGRKRVLLRQLRQERQAFWVRLGKTAYRLVESGEMNHPAVRKAMVRLDALSERIVALEKDLPPEDRAQEADESGREAE